MTAPAFRDCPSDALDSTLLAQLLDLVRVCWPDGGFTADDLAHALGGRHLLAEADGRLVGHAAVVPRTLEVDGRPLRTGYVEAVATHPLFRRQGIATRLVAAADDHIRTGFELGALSTGEHALFERLGWRRWAGPSFVREDDGELTRTEDDDDGIMVLPTAATAGLALTGSIACPRRLGDPW